MKNRFALAVAFTLAAFAAGAQTDQEAPFREKLDVNLVLVDAVVTNDRGEQILGLTKDDFVVRENGTVQQIESVDYYTNRRLATAPEESARFDVERVEEPRYFVFFFDKFSGPAPVEGFDRELWRAINAAKTFVEKDLLPNDYVAVAGHDARLEIYTDFTTDRKRITMALDDARRYGSGNFESSGEPSIVAHLDEKYVREETGWVWDGLTTLGEALQETRGRKIMFLYSPGIPSRSEGVQILESQYYNPMVQALNEANTSVYGINLLQIGADVPSDMNLSRLVEDTGGEYYRRPVNYEKPLDTVENLNNGYYLITYRASHPEGKQGYQEVDVELRNPEFKIKAREGYLY